MEKKENKTNLPNDVLTTLISLGQCEVYISSMKISSELLQSNITQNMEHSSKMHLLEIAVNLNTAIAAYKNLIDIELATMLGHYTDSEDMKKILNNIVKQKGGNTDESGNGGSTLQ